MKSCCRAEAKLQELQAHTERVKQTIAEASRELHEAQEQAAEVELTSVALAAEVSTCVATIITSSTVSWNCTESVTWQP